MTQAPLLNASDTILWLKVVLSVVTLAVLCFRFRSAKATGTASRPLSAGTKAALVLASLFSLGVFHNLGSFSGGTFVHYGEMFHYYLGPKYFKEVGYYDLYNAVIVADAEQDSALAGVPFLTDLRTYQNTQRSTVLEDSDRVRGLFSAQRWRAFKDDVAFFKTATGMPRAPGLILLLMDHGYNGSPLSTLILGTLTNAVSVNQLKLLALVDVLLVVGMGVLVFATFGFEMGGLFCVYFCVNALNPAAFVSGSLLRYDWLFFIVVAVCFIEKRRYASSAVFLTLSAMIRVFPAVLFYGIAVAVVQNLKTTRTVAARYTRLLLAAGMTALVLALLPAASLGSGLKPWQDFAANTELHNAGVYVNHLGLRGIVLFEPSHLSLEKFVDAYASSATHDIVRHWQDIKEREFKQKLPVIVFATLLVLAGLAVVTWNRSDTERILWPLLLVYTASFPSHYYYGFLCLFILLFFSRPNSLRALVPLCLLWVLNIGVLVTDYFRPSPIVFYTLVNIYLLLCMSSILGFELVTGALSNAPPDGFAAPQSAPEAQRGSTPRTRQRTRKGQARRK